MSTDEITASGGSSIELWLSGGEDRIADMELQQRVWDEFAAESRLEGADLRVEVADRVATLEGTVEQYFVKATAERAARRVEGIRAVESRIQVQLRASQLQTDADLRAAAAQALEWGGLVPPERIRVRVEAGVITLDGDVGWESRRAAAVDVVSRLAGVRDVRNRIAIRPPVRPDRLERRIHNALRHVPAPHVTVETRGDSVVLHGRVRSLAQRDRVEHAVWAVPGVADLADEIEVTR
jgi:osmotically-inducible protein OsmY